MERNRECYQRGKKSKQISYMSLCLFVVIVSSGTGYSAENPHGELKFDCETCHTTASWSTIEFSHEGVGFELTDSHARVSCKRCHTIENFSQTASDCRGCHQDIHESRMGPDCERCHTPRRWEIFDAEEIHARTRFPLFGKHVQIDCRNCHADLLAGDYAVSVRNCVDCHEGDYLTTGNPEHVTLGIGTSCSECHEQIAWRPAYFPSHDTIFPIFSGEHHGVWDVCSDCHPNPSNFSVFSCFKCHSRSAMDSEHGDMQGYSYDSQACLVCHPTGGKEGGIGAHDANYFPIFTGTHASTWATCSDCHIVPGDLSLVSCLECHEHDQPTMDNRHTGIPGYSYDTHQCLGCHPTGEGGEFREHDQLYFPIYSGRHSGTWNDCTTCHTDQNSWSIFSCIDCHAHEKSAMDEEHREVNGYSFNSQACYDCHPAGQEMIHWKRPRISR